MNLGNFFSICNVRISMYFKVKSSKIVFDIIIRDIILNFNEYHFFFSGIYSYSYFRDKFFTGGCNTCSLNVRPDLSWQKAKLTLCNLICHWKLEILFFKSFLDDFWRWYRFLFTTMFFSTQYLLGYWDLFSSWIIYFLKNFLYNLSNLISIIYH